MDPTLTHRGLRRTSELPEICGHLTAPLVCLSATSEISREDRICRQNSRRERDSLIRAEISLIADLNSLQGRKNSLFRCVANWLVSLWFSAARSAVGNRMTGGVDSGSQGISEAIGHNQRSK